jgi:tripartite-type tricarboxylate transporter receptor subunit TctC
MLSAAVAQTYPNGPIRMLVPYPPGGGADAAGRIIAQSLTESLHQQVIVDNRPGASGRIGTLLAAKAQPDGYTLLLGNVGPNAIIPGSYSKLPYDQVKDFAPISMVASTDYMLVVHPSFPVKTVKDLIAMAKKNPGRINFASTGILGGEVEMIFGSSPTVVPHVKAGRLRAIATTGLKRTDAIPGTPTIAETLPGYEVTQWYGVLAPAGTPKDIVSRLHADIVAAARQPKVLAQFEKVGAEAVSSKSPEEFAQHIKREMDKWGDVVRKAHVSLE